MAERVGNRFPIQNPAYPSGIQGGFESLAEESTKMAENLTEGGQLWFKSNLLKA